jgi:hypothetical protein
MGLLPRQSTKLGDVDAAIPVCFVPAATGPRLERVSEDAFGPEGDNRPKVFRQGPEGVHVLATITRFHLFQSRQNLCELSEGVFGPTEKYADRSGSPDGIPWNQTRKENNVKHSNAMKLLMDKTCCLLLALVTL